MSLATDQVGGRANAVGAADAPTAGRDGGRATGPPPPAAADPPARPPGPARPAPALVDPTLGHRSGRRLPRLPRVPRPVARLLGPALLLGLWQLTAVLGVVDRHTLPSPAEVWSAAQGLLESGDLQAHMAASLVRVAKGLALGLAVGLPLAVVAGLSRLGENVVDTNMEILRAVPNFALLPLLIIWFGIGEQPKVVLISLSVVVAIYINTYSAIRSVDAGLVEAARTFGVGRWGLVRHVVLPGALPGFLVGLRLALTGTWLALIFAETVNAPEGLGRLMNDAREYFQLDVIFVVLTVYAALGLLSHAFVRFLEARLLVWRRAFDGQ